MSQPPFCRVKFAVLCDRNVVCALRPLVAFYGFCFISFWLQLWLLVIIHSPSLRGVIVWAFSHVFIQLVSEKACFLQLPLTPPVLIFMILSSAFFVYMFWISIKVAWRSVNKNITVLKKLTFRNEASTCHPSYAIFTHYTQTLQLIKQPSHIHFITRLYCKTANFVSQPFYVAATVASPCLGLPPPASAARASYGTAHAHWGFSAMERFILNMGEV